MLNKQWTVQGAVHAGTDMAPWYKGAVPTGMLGVRWVSLDNNDSIYLVLNSINAAKFQRFRQYGQDLGHDNFNYLVGTWQHRFSPAIHTKTEGYFMWQQDAVVGGTPSAGPVRFVRWRRRYREGYPRHRLHLRDSQLHDVRSLQERLLYVP